MDTPESMKAEHPVRLQNGRLAPKQIHTPQTIFRMTEHGQPRRPSGIWCRIVPSRENPSHDILIDGNTEGQRDLLRDPWRPPVRIPLFHVDHRGNDVLVRPFWPRLWRSI